VNSLTIRQVEYARDIGNDWPPVSKLTDQTQ
jgi:hypothetical protein